MPIQKTDAKLWFDSKKEEVQRHYFHHNIQEEYDDRMLANIELKSTDFDDENFSPVFTRATQEFFLEPSERFKSDVAQILKPFTTNTFESTVNKYSLIKPNHTFYRHWTIEKFLGGFGLGYLILRELPLRNFYARCFVMYIFASKFMDHMHSPFPYTGTNGDIVAAPDRWAFWDLRCYDAAWRAARFIEIPTATNRVRESLAWQGKQPGHILRSDVWYVPHYFASPFRNKREASWDGTMNMPMFRLADPKHKDSYMMVYQ